MVVVLRSRRKSSSSSRCSSSSINDPIFKSLRSRDVHVSDPISKPSHRQQSHNPGFQWTRLKKNEPRPSMPHATEALNCFNQNSPKKYTLLKPGNLNVVGLPKCFIYHTNFTAKKTDAADAPVEKFFAELTSTPTIGVYCVRLCVSLGPINSLSGNRLNGCYYCRNFNNFWHPKGGGFVRGADRLYKTLEAICDIDIVDRQKHLLMLKQVSQASEPCEYPSEQVDDAGPHATEVLKFLSQTLELNYVLVDRGFATRVILPTCLLFHVNFKAKGTDPITPEVWFFAELTSTGGVFSVKHCRVLDPRELKSEIVTEDETNGCYYCLKFNKVRHPLDGEFVRGGDSLYISEKEFYCLKENQLTCSHLAEFQHVNSL